MLVYLYEKTKWIEYTNFINDFIERKYRDVEKSFFSIRNIGLHIDYINPICLGFIYKCFCQSIFSYGLELVHIGKTLGKELDVRQRILLKNSLGLSKYSRTRPLLDSLGIESITQLYFKFNILFFQLKK